MKMLHTYIKKTLHKIKMHIVKHALRFKKILDTVHIIN